MDITKLFQTLLSHGDSEDLLQRVDKIIVRKSADAGLTQRKYMDKTGIRAAFEGFKDENRDVISRANSLATLMRRLKTTFDELIVSPPAPWDSWLPGSFLHVLLGERRAKICEMGTVPQRVVGARDVLAVQELHRVVNEELGIDARLQIDLIGLDWNQDAVKELINRIQKNKTTGGIIALGGPNVNPATDILAHQICGEEIRTEDLPARFAWNHTWDWRIAPYLTNPEQTSNEGIHVYENDEGDRNGEQVCLRRISDSDIQEMTESDATAKEYLFEDYGIVLIDNSDSRLFKACLAGHGGWGTIAGVWSLGSLDERLGEGGRLGKQKCFEIIRVDRTKCTNRNEDDLSAIDDFPNNSWDFYWG